MTAICLLRIQSKKTDILEITKSYSLLFYEFILLGFWTFIFFFGFFNETRMGLLNFYRKHLPVGLILLPLATKIILLVPIFMFAITFLSISSGTHWHINKMEATVSRYRYFFFRIRFPKKKWSFEEISSIRVQQKNKRSVFILSIVEKSGKEIVLDKSRDRRKLRKIAQEISILTNKQIRG